MLLSIVQPNYLIGENPAEKNRKYITEQMKNAPENGIMLFPEYSNCGGVSDPEEEKKTLPHAKEILDAASAAAKEKNCIISVNVLEEKDGKIKNSTYLFGRNGQPVFVYYKQHLPVSEINLGVEAGNGAGTPCECICDYEGIRFAFLCCYDVYFNEQIEYIAKFKPDIILIPGMQRGERSDILAAQAKMIAFRCNAYVAKSSFSMMNEERGGCSMIISPDGKIITNLGGSVGSFTADIDLSYKYMRPAGYGQQPIRNDDFINAGLCPEAFR